MWVATQASKGHGRVERRMVNGVAAVEVVYGITGLSTLAADAEKLLGHTRGHWGIENGLHHTRDVTLGEDRCWVRGGRAPRVLASLRNVAVCLLRQADHPNAAAAARAMGAKPELARALLNDPDSISE